MNVLANKVLFDEIINKKIHLDFFSISNCWAFYFLIGLNKRVANPVETSNQTYQASLRSLRPKTGGAAELRPLLTPLLLGLSNRLEPIVKSFRTLPVLSTNGFAFMDDGVGRLDMLNAKLELDEVLASEGLVVIKDDESSE